MPSRCWSACSSPGCSWVGPATRCPAHQRQRRAWDRPPSVERYGPGYTATRARVLREEKGCRICGSPAEPRVDHVVPVAEGGTSDRSNLARLCRTHHDIKSEQERARGKARRK